MHRDFYNCRKVDNHVHHAAAMNAKHLTRFMKRKFKKFKSDVVGYTEPDVGPDGEPIPGSSREITLEEVAAASGYDWRNLTINSLGVWTDRGCMHRFDRFNNKYNPMGQGNLRTLFLKTDNVMKGR